MNKLTFLTPALLLAAQLAFAGTSSAAPDAPAPDAGAANAAAPAARSASELLDAGNLGFSLLYNARTGARPSRLAPVPDGRPWLEYDYSPEGVTKLNDSISDLQKAGEARSEDASEGARIRSQSNMLLTLALVEKAQFVTNAPADFEAALSQIALAKAVAKATNADFDEKTSWKKTPPLIAAELRADIGSGRLFDALNLYHDWAQSGDENVQAEIALPVMVEALDMAGAFNTSKALILESAVGQIRKDGKWVETNHTLNRAATTIWIRQMGEAADKAPTQTMLPLARARRAGALVALGFKLEPEDIAFIKAAPALIKTATGRDASRDTQLYAALLKFGGTDAEKTEARATVEAMLADNWKAPALSLRGYMHLVDGDVAAAGDDAEKAIAEDDYLAFANKAYDVRGTVYGKTGKAAEQERNSKVATLYTSVMKTLRTPRDKE